MYKQEMVQEEDRATLGSYGFNKYVKRNYWIFFRFYCFKCLILDYSAPNFNVIECNAVTWIYN